MSFSPRTIGVALVVASVVSLALVSVAGFGGVGSAAPVRSALAGPYVATFNEVGLPGGSYWSVHVNQVGCSCTVYSKTIKTNTSSLSFDLANGSYTYNVQRVTGFYVIGAAHGAFNVSGASGTIRNATFRPVVTFLTQFNETGLPNGTLWTVSVHGNGTGQLAALEDQVGHSYSSTLAFTLPNGSYRYSVAPVNGSFFLPHANHGTFVINGSAPSPLAVGWITPPVFAITFHESGLPTGMNWTVRVNGFGGVPIHEGVSSTTANVTFYLPNGSYHFAVGQVIFFNVPTPASGAFAVTTIGATYNISFVPVAPGAFYPVAFTENGLANGSHWWVKVVLTHTFGHSRSATASSNGTSLFLLLQNGSYRFAVHGPRTYETTAGGSGNFSILGSAPGAFVVNFTAIPTYTVTFGVTGLPAGTVWSVLVRTGSTGSTPWYIRETPSTNTTTISLALPNGTYCFKFNPVPGFKQTSGLVTGPFSVAGGPTTPIVAGFSPAT